MNLFQFLLSITPQLLAGIVGIQATVKAPGATKKQIILDSLLIASKVGETIPAGHVDAVSQLIDKMVTGLKSAGVFSAIPAPKEVVDVTHTAKPATPGAPQSITVPSAKNPAGVGTPGK